VQLGKAEALRLLDHHQRGVGHVDADLDHGGRHQQLGRAAGEPLHRGVLGLGPQLAMDEHDIVSEALAQQAKRASAAARSSFSCSRTIGQTQ
jgi:hypothetical protein